MSSTEASATLAPPAAAPHGLSRAEAARRLAYEGPNRLVQRERLRTLTALLAALADPMALMLAVAGTVYFLLGETRDGVVLLFSLVPVLAVDVALDLRSRAALKKLAAAVTPRARVLRDGAEEEVPSEAVVRGDLLLLREGEIVHADGVVRAQANLTLDESQLTGESEPQAKSAGAPVFAGSLVLGGQGTAEIVATGPRTKFGNIAQMVADAQGTPTPLQRKTARMVHQLGIFALALAAAMAVFSYHRGEGLGHALLSGISLAMAALPEEFPLVLAIFLSVGAFRLSRAGVLVRRLASVETLGSTTVICTDKTGTLTQGHFGLEELVAFGVPESALMAVAVRACEREPEDTMDRAIVAKARERHLPVDLLHEADLPIDYDFDPLEKNMAHVWREVSGHLRLAAKGALEGLLPRCSLTPAQRAHAVAEQQRMADAGRRVLAVAEKSGHFTGERESDLRDLHLVGLLGFSDPLRPSVPAAIAECQSAGVQVKIVTGDSPVTAHAIAEAAGVVHEHEGGLLTGAELARAGERAILAASIYSRVEPGQKYLIVEAHQRAGEVVAMTGDGINDAPALRKADVGVSMGRRGTAVARAAADLILLHDDFGGLVTAVREGRRVFQNLVNSFLYLIAFHVPVIALAVLVPLAGLPPLLLPIHLVWLELIVHPVSALVFEGDPVGDGMRRPPRSPLAPILPRGRLALSVVTGALLAAAAFWAYAHWLPLGQPAARSVAMVTVVAGGLLIVLAERGARPGARLLAVCGPVAASVPLAIYLPPLAAALQLSPPDGAGWATGLLLAALAVGWRPIAKILRATGF
ncbi:MAG TPA: HAD-IC family P-type ATPase [Myxococcales bacterium]|nr:HAD-IC family P-type ATPase [Myxococcales bacterium]